MAAHVKVIDTSFRQHTIKVTPGKYMTEVLEEACKKFGINPNNYSIKHQNKPVDLSRTFRQTGFSSGAKLELVVASRSPSVVSIALQLPESIAVGAGTARLVDKFPSDTTLWLVLRKFESTEGKNLNFTERGVASTESGNAGAGRIFYETPVLNLLGRELATFGDLQKTLAQLGLNSGSGLIRLTFRKTEQPLEEAISEIGQYFKGTAVEEKKEPEPQVDFITDQVAEATTTELDGSQDVDMISFDTSQDDNSQDPTPYPERVDQELVNPALVPQPKAHEPTPPVKFKTEEVMLGPNLRPMTVFAPPSSTTPQAALRPSNDADFEPTISSLKGYQQSLEKKTVNKRLESDAEAERLEKEQAAALAAITEVNIKLRFPDQTSVQGSFDASTSGTDLYNYVRAVMASPDQPFKLTFAAPKGMQTIPNDAGVKLIKDLRLKGSVLVNFLWEAGASDSARKSRFLKQEVAEKAKEIRVADEPVGTPVEEKGAPTAPQQPEKEGTAKKLKTGVTPKWLKGLGGKKK
ncbi:GLUT4 regulating protein TUG-domain-containing protein [Halenospora varia]|nr:GLUT4 regulating protein TUG-domain-containing protein [Halenospora varia]